MKFGTWLETRIYKLEDYYMEAISFPPQMVQQAQDGQASPEFWERVNTMLVRFLQSKQHALGLNHADAQDIAQDAAIKIMNGITSLENPAAFQTFALRTAHRLAMNFSRNRGRMRNRLGGGTDLQSVEDSEKGAAIFQADPNAVAPDAAMTAGEGKAERSARLKEILSKLAPKERDMLIDFYINNQTYVDLYNSGKYTKKDGITPMPLGSIKRNLNILRQKVRDMFDGNPFEENVVLGEFDWQADLLMRLLFSM